MRWWFDLEKIEIPILTLNSLRGKVNKEKGGVTARWRSSKNGRRETEKRALNNAPLKNGRISSRERARAGSDWGNTHTLSGGKGGKWKKVGGRE